jgi:hypothetical protein
MATKAFDKPSNYINPYIDELVGLDAFHRFTDLSLESRQMLYEQYFADEHRSIACKYLPDIYEDARILLHMPHGKRWNKTTPFLPSFCLTSRTSRAEAASILAGSAWCEIGIIEETAAFILSNPRTSRVLDRVQNSKYGSQTKHHKYGCILTSQVHSIRVFFRGFPRPLRGVTNYTAGC